MTLTLLDPRDRQKQARELAELWSRVSRQHLSGGLGCSCNGGGLMLRASDFELDIVEFLINDADKAGRTAIEPFVNKVAARGRDRYSLPALFSAIAEGNDLASDEDLEFALSRLKTTLTSIEKAHSKGRFACD